jgi:hypothetical protein
LAIRSLARIIEVEAGRHVERFGVDGSHNLVAEYEAWRGATVRQLRPLYETVCLDRAVIFLADAIAHKTEYEQRRWTALCEEKSSYRAMHALYQWDRPRSRRALSNTGYFQRSELADLFGMKAESVRPRVSATERTLILAESSQGVKIANPKTYLAASGTYHLSVWRPLAAGSVTKEA